VKKIRKLVHICRRFPFGAMASGSLIMTHRVVYSSKTANGNDSLSML